MDRIPANRRSENMRRIRSSNTKPELVVRSMLHKLGYRFRLHYKNLPGRPDLVFVSRRKAIFVHGCFWHQHKGCADGRLPKSQTGYWLPKLAGNQERDRLRRGQLRRLGWHSLAVWDCQTKDREKLEKRLLAFLA